LLKARLHVDSKPAKTGGSKKKSPGVAHTYAFSHPMVLVNLDGDGKTRTVYIGKDPKKLTKFVVKGAAFVGVDVDPD
jgi:hypothetical protein